MQFHYLLRHVMQEKNMIVIIKRGFRWEMKNKFNIK